MNNNNLIEDMVHLELAGGTDFFIKGENPSL